MILRIGRDLKWASLRHETPGLKMSPTHTPSPSAPSKHLNTGSMQMSQDVALLCSVRFQHGAVRL